MAAMDNSDKPSNSSPVTVWRLLLVTVAILCVVYFPIWLGRIVFRSDVAHWTLPARWLVRDSLLRGEWPGWNPFQGIGFAILADPLYGVFYPPNWLYLIVPPDWLASLVTWQDFAHLVWGGVGMFFVARRLVGSPVAACVAALAWSLAGYNTSQWTAGMRMVGGAWVPWAAAGHLALLDSLRRGGRGWLMGAVKAALPTACGLLVGEVFVTMMGVGFALATAATAEVLERGRDLARARFRARWMGVFALAPALAAGVGAITLVPAYALKGSTARAGALSRADAEANSLHPVRLVEFVAPDSMGNSEGFQPAARWIAEPGLENIPLSNNLYMGASVVALALAAFGRRRSVALVLGVLASGALLLALGRYLPVHAVFRRVVFPFAYMRHPEKYTVVLVGCLALLAAAGTARTLAAERQPWRRVAVLLGLLLMLALLARFFFPGHWAAQVTRGALAGGLAVAGVLTVQFLVAKRLQLGPILVIAVVGLDLAAQTWPLQVFAPRQIAAVSAPAARVVLADSPGHGEPPRSLDHHVEHHRAGLRERVAIREPLCADASARIGRVVAVADPHYQYCQYLGHCHFARVRCGDSGGAGQHLGIRAGRRTIGAALARGALCPVVRRGSAGSQREAQGHRAHARSLAWHPALPCPGHAAAGVSGWAGAGGGRCNSVAPDSGSSRHRRPHRLARPGLGCSVPCRSGRFTTRYLRPRLLFQQPPAGDLSGSAIGAGGVRGAVREGMERHC